MGATLLFGVPAFVRAANPSHVVEASAGTVVVDDGDALDLTSPDAADRGDRLSRIRARETGTYIAEILLARDSSLARWPTRARPLAVWIAPGLADEDWNPAFRGEVRAAFEAWTDGLPFRFAFVRDSATADVHVVWTTRFSESISGRTRWARDDRWWITDAVITLAVHHHQGPTLDRESMRAMAMHEVGHLLGLDHTTDEGSVMAPRVRVRHLSDADLATARLLYSLPAGDVR